MEKLQEAESLPFCPTVTDFFLQQCSLPTRASYIFLYLESCKYQEIAGDGICNDEANILDCKFDFGDCCLMAINDTMCADCECHSTQLVPPKLSGKLVHKSEI